MIVAEVVYIVAVVVMFKCRAGIAYASEIITPSLWSKHSVICISIAQHNILQGANNKLEGISFISMRRVNNLF